MNILLLVTMMLAQDVRNVPVPAAAAHREADRAPDNPNYLKGVPNPPRLTPNFLHASLRCLAPFVNINEFPVVAWSFPNARGGLGNRYPFVKAADDAGFNVLIARANLIRSVVQFDRMMLMPVGGALAEYADKPQLKHDDMREAADQKTHITNHLSGNSRVIGILISHNASVFHASQTLADMASDTPHLLPYLGANLNPGKQAQTNARVLSTQNFSLGRTSKTEEFCSKLDADRTFANKHDMAIWPLITAPVAAARYRFQMFASAAYGAQGIVVFGYSPCDRWPEWFSPGGSMYVAAKPVNLQIRSMGYYLWGCRCIDVYHGQGDLLPRGGRIAGPGKPVEVLSSNALIGLLAPEGTVAPQYAVLVSKDLDAVRSITVRFAAGTGLRIGETAIPGPLATVRLEPGEGCLIRLTY